MNWYFPGMMDQDGFGSFWIIASLFQVVILIDLILFGMWMFKQIKKK